MEGEPACYSSNEHSGSGEVIHLYFCPKCSSPLYANPEKFPGMTAVKTGILDTVDGKKTDPMTAFKPAAESWTCNRPEWLSGIEGAVQRSESK